MALRPPNKIKYDFTGFEGENARKVRDFVREMRGTKHAIHSKGIGFLTGQLNAKIAGIFEKLGSTPKQIAEAMDIIAIFILSRVIKRTPIENPATDEMVAILRWDMSVDRSGAAIQWNITNDATGGSGYPYVVALEYGWSDQAPKGMIRITIDEMRAEMDKIFRARVKAALKGDTQHSQALETMAQSEYAEAIARVELGKQMQTAYLAKKKNKP